MLKAIVFDFDGVIVDSEPLHYRAFLRVVQPLGVTFDYSEYLRRFVGFDDRDAFNAILATSPTPNLARDPRKVADLCARKAKAFEEIVHEQCQPIPGALELVCQAREQMPVAIASGATRADIDLVLGKLGLVETFGVIVTADDVARSKPDPQTYQLAVSRLAQAHPETDLHPPHCLSIEDTAAGVTAARSAGLMSLGLNSLGDRSQLHAAHRIIDSLEGLTIDTLRQWFD